MSEKGKQFISDLKFYLISIGKNEEEIKEFIKEAEEHLKLGEMAGKSIQDIFGSSPDEYVKSISNEVPYNKKDIFKNIMMLLFGFAIIMFFNKIKFGIIEFSTFELVLDIAIYAVTIIAFVFVFRKFAFNDKIFSSSLFGILIANIVLLVAANLITKSVPKNIIFNKMEVSVFIIAAAIICLIISVKIKTFLIFSSFIIVAPAISSVIFDVSRLNTSTWVLIESIFILLAILFIRFESERIMK